VNTIFRVIELLPKSRFSSVLGVLRLLRFIRARNKNKIARKTALDVKRNFCCKRRFCRVKQRDDLPKISPWYHGEYEWRSLSHVNSYLTFAISICSYWLRYVKHKECDGSRQCILRCFETPKRSLKIPHNLVLRTPPKYTKTSLMTISVFRWNSCGVSKCLNGNQGQFW